MKLLSSQIYVSFLMIAASVFIVVEISMGSPVGITEFPIASIPEPATMLLMGTGLIGLSSAFRNKLIKK